MNDYEVVLVQRRECGASFGAVVRVEVAGGSGYGDVRQSSVATYSSNQIHRGDARTAYAESRFEGLELAMPPLPPKPYISCRVLPEVATNEVHIVLGKYLPRTVHRIAHALRADANRLIVRHCLAGDVVRRRTLALDAFGIVHHQQMAIGHADVKRRPEIRFDGAQILNNPLSLLPRDVPRSEVLHPTVDDGDQVAPENQIVRDGFDLACGGFQRRPPGIVHRRVVYPIMVSVATSLAGVYPSGTVRRQPCRPFTDIQSMLGIRAASNGVRSSSSATGSSAAPSGMISAYFINSNPLVVRRSGCEPAPAIPLPFGSCR